VAHRSPRLHRRSQDQQDRRIAALAICLTRLSRDSSPTLTTSQAYVHPEFRGRTSIKAVLTALVPDLSYKSLAIQEGGSAGDAWNRMVSGELDTRTAEQTARGLLAYCGLDTRAMVEIWRVLEETVATEYAVKVD